jgi:hypothetical protein
MAVSAIAKGLSQLLARNVGARMSAPVYQGKPIEQTLKLQEFAQKQAQQLGPEDAAKIIGEGEEGLPTLLYHRIMRGREPFEKFILKTDKSRDMIESTEFTPGSDVYPFLSTGLSKKGMSKWTDSRPEDLEDMVDILHKRGIPTETGERVAIGMGKVDKLFDHNNPEHVDDVINYLWKKLHDDTVVAKKDHLNRMKPKTIKEKFEKKVKTLDGKIKTKYRVYGKQEPNPAVKDLEPWDIHPKDYFIYTELPKGHPEGTWFGNTSKELDEEIKSRIKRSQKDFDSRYGKDGEEITSNINRQVGRIKKDLRKGNWEEIEETNVQHALKQLGYDAFTTVESGKNVMLFNPNEQFVPLFDPLKKSAIGFSRGGGLSSLNERVK